MNRALIKVSPELLLQCLHLPEDTELIGVRYHGAGDVEMVISHHELNPVPKDKPIPTIRPLFALKDGGEVALLNWGQQ